MLEGEQRYSSRAEAVKGAANLPELMLESNLGLNSISTLTISVAYELFIILKSRCSTSKWGKKSYFPDKVV